MTNWQIAALALYSLGGATSRQHQEDVAVKCYEFAPRRFRWEKYEYPNLDIVGKALRDAKHVKNGSLVSGDKRLGWLLSPAGVDWASRNGPAGRDMDDGGSSVLPAAEGRELRLLKSHQLFGGWEAGSEAVSVFLVADAVGLTADAPIQSIARRITELQSAARAGRQRDVEGFLRWLMDSLNASSS